jgi:hypothetical protein
LLPVIKQHCDRISHASALALLINVDLIGVQPRCFPFGFEDDDGDAEEILEAADADTPQGVSSVACMDLVLTTFLSCAAALTAAR